jgi:hypothetical protein
LKIIGSADAYLVKQSILIIDEFDSVAFSKDDDHSLLLLLKKKMSSRVIAFTGSNLQGFHAKFIETQLGLGLVRMNVKQHDKPVLSCIGTSVHSTVTDQRKQIENICI